MNKKFKVILPVAVIAGFLSLAVWYLRHTTIPILEPRGPVGLQERNLLLFALGLSLFVIIPVFSLLIFIAWKYRESNESAKYSPDFDHSRIIETVWWLIPSLMISVLSVVAWNSSHSLDPYRPLNSTTPPMTIQVVALDWKWLFIYPQQHIASVNLVQFPKNTPIDFQITSDSVMNSFWIPQLGGQIYSMPGMSSQLHLMASQDGSFNGLSANISGTGFAGMTFVARSSSLKAFEAWAHNASQSQDKLSLAAYNKLDRPSQNNPVAFYSSPTKNLYGTILAKYDGPGTAMSGMYTGGSASMSGMGMQ
ncbi:MAG TPA: ubiquinol oxidase subunit II [Candidatus Dormibacteraeota bacterium]|nr:ubiquinol oxidase subunit II [Candidatus Dormibacteraeota bacterium]